MTTSQQELQFIVDQMWTTYDNDKSGALDKQELKLMFLDNPDMSKEEVDAIYEQAFIIYDKDNSGLIDKQEVVDYLKEQSFFKEESFGNNLSQNLKSRSASSIIMTTSDQELRFIVDQMWTTADNDKSGALDKQELKLMFEAPPDMSQEEVDAIYEQAFNTYDKDNSGLVEKQEVVDYLKEQSFFKEQSFGNNLSQNLKSRSASSYTSPSRSYSGSSRGSSYSYSPSKTSTTRTEQQVAEALANAFLIGSVLQNLDSTLGQQQMIENTSEDFLNSTGLIGIVGFISFIVMMVFCTRVKNNDTWDRVSVKSQMIDKMIYSKEQKEQAKIDTQV